MLESATMPAPYEYPTLKTGTSQDLFTIITRSYERKLAAEGTVLPVKSRRSRLLLEAPFVLLGKGVAAFMRALPTERAFRVQNRLYSTLSAPRSYPFDEKAPQLERARALAARLEKDAGRAPALVALISHPPVMGDLAHLNFELVRHASLALRAVRGAACRPQLVVAIDPFALDTAPLSQEGIYAGFMGSYHLGFDRMAVGRNPVSRWFLRRAAWDRMAHRLLRVLGGGGEVGMVLAGGVPSTTRVLYAAREWVGEARRQSALSSKPAEILSRLRRLPGFARMESAGPHGARLRGSAWRLAEAYAMALLAGVYVEQAQAGRACADLGCFDEGTRRSMLELLDALGLSAEQAAESLARLSEELGRETPFRRRFFRVLAGRVARQRPVVLLPIVHRLQPQLGVELREAWGWRGVKSGMIDAVVAGPVASDWSMRPQDFAVHFVRENFS